MKRTLLTFVLPWLLCCSPIHAAWALSLDDALNEALRSNPKLLAAGQELEETRQKIRQAFAGYLPTIDFNMGTGREWVNTPTTRIQDRGGLTMDRGEAGMNINQPIFDGFNTVHKVTQAKAQVEGADYSFLDVAETVTLDVSLAYAEVLKQRKLLEVAKEAMTLHSQILVKTRQTTRLGITAEMDARLAESRVALIASDLASTEGLLRSAESRFVTLVGFPPPGTLDIPRIDPKQLPTTRDDAMGTAMSRHPALLAAKADLDATRAESKATAASLWPKISLEMAVSDSANASGTRSYSQDASAMLRFKYNLFRGGSDTSRFKESSFKAARFRDKMEEVRQQIEEKVNRAWNALLASRARTQSLEKHLETIQAVNRDHQEQHRLGSESLLDLLNSEHELQAAKRLLVEEEFQFLMESFRLLAAMGRLKETLVQPDPPASAFPATMAQTQTTTPAPQAVAPPAPSQPPEPPRPPVTSALPTTPNRPENNRIAASATDAPLTSAQEEAMNGLVDALFQSEPATETPQSLQTPATPPVQTTRLPEQELSAQEARAALAETVRDNHRPPSQGKVSNALDALARTVHASSEHNPSPADNIVPTSKPSPDPNTLQAMENIPLQQFVHLMSDDETKTASRKPTPDLLQYTIQVGSFRDEGSAIKLIGQLQDKGHDLYLREIQDDRKQTRYQVSIGRMENEQAARQTLKRFTDQEGRPGIIIPVPRQGSSTVSEPMPFTNPPPQKGQAENRTTPSTGPNPAGYAVQVAAFLDPTETDKKLVQLSAKGLDLYLCETRDADGRTWQLIWIGRYPDKEQAAAAAAAYFQNLKEPAQVIEIRPSSPEDPQVITRVGSPA
ncbi:MAG: TolC family outer membrane protein [Magnetococcales bacterium]|nr:TolC family outer membrane protein [Magnetococcales bacterium]